MTAAGTAVRDATGPGPAVTGSDSASLANLRRETEAGNLARIEKLLGGDDGEEEADEG